MSYLPYSPHLRRFVRSLSTHPISTAQPHQIYSNCCSSGSNWRIYKDLTLSPTQKPKDYIPTCPPRVTPHESVTQNLKCAHPPTGTQGSLSPVQGNLTFYSTSILPFLHLFTSRHDSFVASSVKQLCFMVRCTPKAYFKFLTNWFLFLFHWKAQQHCFRIRKY